MNRMTHRLHDAIDRINGLELEALTDPDRSRHLLRHAKRLRSTLARHLPNWAPLRPQVQMPVPGALRYRWAAMRAGQSAAIMISGGRRSV